MIIHLRMLAVLMAFAVSRGFGSAADVPVRLPPVIVSESTASRPWRYAKSGSIEVLTRCSDGDTRRILRREGELMELLALVLPPEFQFRTTMPQTMVIVDSNEAPASAQRLVGSTRATFLPNLELMDADRLILFEIVDSNRLEQDAISFSAEHLRWLVDLRAPPLPRWLRTGYHRLFREVQFGAHDVRFPPMRWLSPEETRALSTDRQAPRELLPLADFFHHDADPRTAGAEVWEAQAELLLRWCLATPQRREALRRFAAEPGPEPWDVRLRACFGLGPTDLRDRLSDELPDAVARALTLELTPTRDPDAEVRLAQPSEIARIRGEWDRLTALYVRRRHPEFAAAYAEMAKRIVTGSAPGVDEDAGVLVARGFYELDLGSRTLARPWLEAAAARAAVRPRLHVELARMRLDDAIAAVGQDGVLSPAQAEVVLAELARTQGLQPSLAATDAMTVEVWFRAGLRLDAARREALQATLARHPYDPPLLYWAAALCAQSGARDMAVMLIRQGLAVVDSDERKTSFEQLLASLKAAAKR